jgi:HD-GYP domain-containing protein (c-di-GMP phosphodiesterase class II)
VSRALAGSLALPEVLQTAISGAVEVLGVDSGVIYLLEGNEILLGAAVPPLPARGMGVPEAELVHLRRGARLHDIGTLVVPDSIMQEPGPLTEAEWEVIRRHPEHAREMLLEIDYLAPAIDIPHCHHERWDGSGYPRGLQGEEIALAARVFAVADVYDALTSDRPYRPAWSPAAAAAHLREQAGRQFDPRAVAPFLGMALPRRPMA